MVGLAAIAIAIAVVAYASLRSCHPEQPSEGPVERSFELAISGGKLAEDQRTVRVWEDDSVRLRWTSDEPLTIHLHGYDIETLVAPGVMAEMEFTANATGRFPVAVHGEEDAAGDHDEAPLAVVEVYPR